MTACDHYWQACKWPANMTKCLICGETYTPPRVSIPEGATLRQQEPRLVAAMRARASTGVPFTRGDLLAAASTFGGHRFAHRVVAGWKRAGWVVFRNRQWHLTEAGYAEFRPEAAKA